MRYVLIMFGLLAIALSQAFATEYNLREYLAARGIDAATCTTGRDDAAGFESSKLFNGVTNSASGTERWLAGASAASTAIVTFAIPDSVFKGSLSAFIVKRYRLYRNTIGSDPNCLARSPLSWTIDGSIDGVNWTVLNAGSASSADWSSQVLEFSVSSTTPVPCRYLRFSPTKANNYTGGYKVGLMEMEFDVEPYKGVDLRSYLSARGKLDTWLSSCVHGGNDATNYGAERLFDGIKDSTATADRWLSGQTDVTKGTVTMDFPQEIVAKGVSVTRYTLYRLAGDSGTTDFVRAPTSWKLEGSSDGVSWTTLHSVSSCTWNNTLLKVSYGVTNNMVCRQLRFAPLTTGAAAGITWKVGLRELEIDIAPKAVKGAILGYR